MTPLDLRNIRTNAGLSQRDLAKKLDVSPDKIRGWERQGKTVNPATVSLYESAINVEADTPSSAKKMHHVFLGKSKYPSGKLVETDEKELLELCGASWK